MSAHKKAFKGYLRDLPVNAKKYFRKEAGTISSRLFYFIKEKA